MTWRPMIEHVFPWNVRDVIVAAFYKDEPEEVDIFRCHVAEHGALFLRDGGMLSLHEHGWVPYAWHEDDTPARDDAKWPPFKTDYLTEAQS